MKQKSIPITFQPQNSFRKVIQPMIDEKSFNYSIVSLYYQTQTKTIYIAAKHCYPQTINNPFHNTFNEKRNEMMFT